MLEVQILEIFFWLVSTLGAAIISLFISLLFNEPLTRFLASIIVNTARTKQSIEGTWVATFYYTEEGIPSDFVEVIELKKRFGIVVGRIIPDSRNYFKLKTVESSKPFRLRGEELGGKYLTGVWYHPIETNRTVGSFQLIIESDYSSMHGQWLGFSKTKDVIDSGIWHWKRKNDH